MNVLVSWLLTHWRIVGPTAAALVALVVNVAKPGGAAFLLTNWETVFTAAVALVTWCVHAWKHVQAGTPITEAFPVVPGLLNSLTLPTAAPETFLDPTPFIAIAPTPPLSNGNG